MNVYRITGFLDFFHRPVYLGVERANLNHYYSQNHRTMEKVQKKKTQQFCVLYTIVRTL
jgi:hypothetical protein